MNLVKSGRPKIKLLDMPHVTSVYGQNYQYTFHGYATQGKEMRSSFT